MSFNAFLNFDRGTSLDRSLEFNENNKANPSAVATAELGPWTRATSQWTAENNDETWSAGVGTTWQIVPGKATLIADYTASLATIDINYAGFGVTNFDGTPFPPNHQFAFSSPSTVSEDWHVVNLRLEIPVRAIVVVTSYTYENYSLDDWMQSDAEPWVESVGADTLLRDTSRSFQWGNRLFNLGTYLAPRYTAHIGFVGLQVPVLTSGRRSTSPAAPGQRQPLLPPWGRSRQRRGSIQSGLQRLDVPHRHHDIWIRSATSIPTSAWAWNCNAGAISRCWRCPVSSAKPSSARA